MISWTFTGSITLEHCGVKTVRGVRGTSSLRRQRRCAGEHRQRAQELGASFPAQLFEAAASPAASPRPDRKAATDRIRCVWFARTCGLSGSAVCLYRDAEPEAAPGRHASTPPDEAAVDRLRVPAPDNPSAMRSLPAAARRRCTPSWPNAASPQERSSDQDRRRAEGERLDHVAASPDAAVDEDRHSSGHGLHHFGQRVQRAAHAVERPRAVIGDDDRLHAVFHSELGVFSGQDPLHHNRQLGLRPHPLHPLPRQVRRVWIGSAGLESNAELRGSVDTRPRPLRIPLIAARAVARAGVWVVDSDAQRRRAVVFPPRLANSTACAWVPSPSVAPAGRACPALPISASIALAADHDCLDWRAPPARSASRRRR